MKALLLTQPMPAAPFIDEISSRAPGLELLEYRSAVSDGDLADVEIAIGWQLPAYSYLSTTIGSTRVARRAGR
jgi:hypothetical protein